MSRIEHLGRVSYLSGGLAKLHKEEMPISLLCVYVVTARIKHYFLALLVLSEDRKYFGFIKN